MARIARKAGRLIGPAALVALLVVSASSPVRAAAIDTAAPRISGLRVSADQGRVYYRLSERAEVEFLLERRRTGRVVGQNCLAVSRSNRGNRPCSLWLPRGGTFKGPGGPGGHYASIPGPTALGPGAYRLTMTATDRAGNVAFATRRF